MICPVNMLMQCYFVPELYALRSQKVKLEHMLNRLFLKFSIEDFETSITRFLLFFFFFFFYPKVEKLNISANYKAIILIYSVNLPMIFIYKFCKKEIQIKPPGHHIGEIRQKKFELHTIL